MDEATHILIAAALPWIDDRLAHQGICRTGEPEEPRVRTWATTVEIPTDQGSFWFKAASPVTAHEIRLYPLLASTAPGLILQPVGIDADRAWMLLPDGGTSLLHSSSGDDLVERIATVAPRYALLQRAMTPHVSTMLDLGVPDMRPTALPERFDEAVARARDVASRLGGSDDVDAILRVAALRNRYLGWCEALDTSPIQPSIDHSDLHANNILVPEDAGGTARIYDWGDSAVAHPFSTLLVLLRSLMDRLETTPGDPRLARVRDAYLEPFSDLARHAELVDLADAACWASVVTRAVTWMNVLELGPPADPAWATAPVEWMKTFLNDSWLN